MDIYAYNGKALQYNGKCISPKASGETWVLNDSIDVGKFGLDATLIQFVSNSESFCQISGRDEDGLHYTHLNGDDIEVYNEETGLWVNQVYRTITFLEPLEEFTFGNIVQWLQTNGTKQ